MLGEGAPVCPDMNQPAARLVVVSVSVSEIRASTVVMISLVPPLLAGVEYSRGS